MIMSVAMSSLATDLATDELSTNRMHHVMEIPMPNVGVRPSAESIRITFTIDSHCSLFYMNQQSPGLYIGTETVPGITFQQHVNLQRTDPAGR